MSVETRVHPDRKDPLDQMGTEDFPDQLEEMAALVSKQYLLQHTALRSPQLCRAPKMENGSKTKLHYANLLFT